MKLQTKKVIYVGLAFMIICMFWQVYDNVISKMLINTFGLNQTWSGIVMALDNLFALFMLPLFGTLSDKTKTKYGKRTPYIFIGVIVSAIFLVGVSVFDDLQAAKLEENSTGYVVKVEDKLFDEDNEYYYLVEDLTEEAKAALLANHGGDYWYKTNYDGQLTDLYDFANMSAQELAKVVRFSDTELSEELFVNNLTFLNNEDKEEFAALLAMTHEERTEITVTSSKGLLAAIFGGEATNSYSRKYAKEIAALELRIAERLLEQNEDTIIEYCKANGLKEFFTEKEDATQVRGKLAWNYTRHNVGYLIGFLGILLLTLIAMATYRTPAVSLMPDVTIKPLRSKANAIINLMGTIGGIIALGLMSFLSVDYHSYMLLFIIVGLLMIGMLVVFMFKVNEPQLVEEMKQDSIKYGLDLEEEEANEADSASDMTPEVRKSFYLITASIIFWFMAYNAATTKFSVYAGDVLNMGYTLPLLIANGTALISYIPIGVIASKVGRKKTILAGVAILFLAFFLGSIATENTKFLIYLTLGIAGIGWATINVNSYPMVVEMSKGSNVGKYTGYYYTASMFAQIITPVISGMIMDAFGTMRVLFPYSVVFCIFAFLTMSFVKHGDSKPIAVKSVEAFDIDD